MKINNEKVKLISQLAGFEIAPEEIEAYKRELSKILDFVDQLNEIGVQSSEAQIFGDFFNVFDEDKPSQFANKEKIIENFPDKEKGFLKIKAVFKD